MTNEHPEEQPRPIKQSTLCRCGHTYSWHEFLAPCTYPGCRTCRDFVPADQA